MLNNTSWAGYCYVIVILYSVYYLITGMYYHKRKLGQLFSGKGLSLRAAGQNQTSQETHSLYNQSAIDEVRAFCDQHAKDGFIKHELLNSLKILLAKHVSVKSAGQSSQLDAAIQGELEKRCSIHLSQAEMDLLWEG